MCSLKNLTASAAEGKERSGESSCSFGHWKGVAPAGPNGVEVCVKDPVGAVVDSHAARAITTGSQTMSLLPTRDALLSAAES
jgi:hypothetical protein